MCSPSAHNFKPILDGGFRALYCGHCGEVRGFDIVVNPTPWKYEREDALPQQNLIGSPPEGNAVENLERSVQELEADVLERIRDGLGTGESWSSILGRAGVDPNSDFARSMAAKAGVQREVGFHEVHDLPLFKNVTPPTDRGPVGDLSPEERALIEESNRYEQRRRVVDEGDRLEAGL